MATSAAQGAAAPPVAAAPATAQSGGAAGGVQPAPGQGFVPAGAAGQNAAPSEGSAQGIDLAKGLAALEQAFGDEYGKPVVAADGNIYMPMGKPDVVGEKLAIRYVLAGRIDPASGKMLVNPELAKKAQSKRDPQAKLTQIEDKFFWQTLQKTEDGQLVAKLDPASEADVQAAKAQAEQQQAQEGLQSWNQNRMDWIQKIGQASLLMRVGGYGGSLLQNIAEGPSPITGRMNAGANWASGYMVMQSLDAVAGGKLLPQWMKTGKTGIAMEWLTQAYFMLDMGYQLQTLGAAMPRTAALMRAFTAPTRAVFNGVKGIVGGVAAATAPAAGATGAIAGAATAAGVPSNVAALVGVGPTAEAFARIQQAARAGASGVPSEVMNAMKGLASEVVQPGVGAQVVGTGGLADKVAVMTREGTLQLVPKDLLKMGAKEVMPKPAGLLGVREGVNNIVHGGFKSLMPAIKPLMTGASILGAVSSLMNLTFITKNYGVDALWKMKDGRGAMLGMLSSMSFLGMMIPAVATLPQANVIFAGLGLASNIFGGLSMLNYAGMFGEGGYLDHDAVRAAFLIPPLTPVGLFSLWMKRREKAEKKKTEALEANKQKAVQTLQQVRGLAEQTLQSGGQMQNARKLEDGSIVIDTGVPEDLSKPVPDSHAALNEGTARTLQLLQRRFR